MDTVYLVFVEGVEWSEVVGVFSSPKAAAECEEWVIAQLAQASNRDLDRVCVRAWNVGGATHRGMWRVWITLTGEVDGDPWYDPKGSVVESYQMKRNDEPCGWAATGETIDDAYTHARLCIETE